MKIHLNPLVILLFWLLIFFGCSRSENSTSKNTTNSSNQTVSSEHNSGSLNTKFDKSLQNVASEFQRRLGYYNGNLLSLNLNNGRVIAEWNSQKCDWIREEITDLAISINRGYKDSVKGIKIKRICNSDTKEYSISGEKFDRYKSGQINDSQFLEGIK